MQTVVKAYLDMLLNDLGYAGFRYDMVKGYAGLFTGIYNSAAKPRFCGRIHGRQRHHRQGMD